MLEALLGMDTIISLVLAVVWLGAGYVLGRLALYSETRKLLWWAKIASILINTPVQMVKEGELIRMTLVNRSFDHHPLHLHGHHMLVLSRKGKASTGSPWWTDTLNVAPGESFDVGFVADNPGIWMDHCHNLNHASTGMTMHLAYEGVVTPFKAGRATGNMPE